MQPSAGLPHRIATPTGGDGQSVPDSDLNTRRRLSAGSSASQGRGLPQEPIPGWHTPTSSHRSSSRRRKGTMEEKKKHTIVETKVSDHRNYQKPLPRPALANSIQAWRASAPNGPFLWTLMARPWTTGACRMACVCLDLVVATAVSHRFGTRILTRWNRTFRGQTVQGARVCVCTRW